MHVTCLYICTVVRGGSMGARPLFLAKSILFFTLYTMSEKMFLKLNFDFIVAEIRGVFGSVGGVCGVCVSVWSHRPTLQISRFYLISVGFEIVASTVFCSAKAQFWMISDAILIPKIYARLQEIASNFSKFSGGGPPDLAPALAPLALGSGLRPLTEPPFPKFLDPPLIVIN